MFKFLYLFLTTLLGMNFILVVGFVYERKIPSDIDEIQVKADFNFPIYTVRDSDNDAVENPS